VLEFYWRDPEPGSMEAIDLPRPETEWRYYYEPALSLSDSDSEPMATERELADVRIEIHPEVRRLLREGQWSQARHLAIQQRLTFISEGYRPDGIKLTAGESWREPYEPRERGGS
jgi:hypothetical protein